MMVREGKEVLLVRDLIRMISKKDQKPEQMIEEDQGHQEGQGHLVVLVIAVTAANLGHLLGRDPSLHQGRSIYFISCQ